MFKKLKAKRKEVEEALRLKVEVDEIRKLNSRRNELNKDLHLVLTSTIRIETSLEELTESEHVFSDCGVHNIKKELHGILKYEEMSKTNERVKDLLQILVAERIQAKEIYEEIGEIDSLIKIKKDRLF